MEEFMETSDLDKCLINEIVCKVKSEGLFDQFRRECLADVDTKPAFQNLQNRVESSVCSFLEEQQWNSQMNKNQLRERLKKLVLEKKFFEAGIERIVDQVVIPKLNANFVPKIEDVAYKLMGIERPSMNMEMKLEIDTTILPVNDLEQVSPDSDNDLKHPNANASNKNLNMFECENDLESPAFEPIGPSSTKTCGGDNGDDDMDISSDDDDIPHQNNEMNSISGLTSNESNNSSNDFDETSTKNRSHENTIETESHADKNCFDHKQIDQDGELSQVSSDTSTSRLSIVTNEENSKCGQIDTTTDSINVDCLGISEETQMQKFNENSSSNDSSAKYSLTQFNIKNDKIKFEGTDRMQRVDSNNACNDEEKSSMVAETDGKANEKLTQVKSAQKSQSSKKDDHFTHKGKSSARQRSHSKDSNDGFTNPNKQNCTMQPTINTNQSRSSNEQAYTPTNGGDKTTNAGASDAESLFRNQSSHPVGIGSPVVIDQILVGNELDLKSFIVENRADPIVSSMEADIISSNVKKPRLAENMAEAKRLIKVRKQIELRYQKKIEQTTVKAKQYLRTNATNTRNESQGIELEFVCSTPSTANESDTFSGFDSKERDRAYTVHQTFYEKANEYFTRSNTSSEIILANVFISDAESLGKHRQKARYSHEDLFKPRPVLCGIPRRRRFQEN